MKAYLEPVGKRNLEHTQLHIARRTMAPVTMGSPANHPGEPVPIWLAVLQATSCEAKRNGEYHAVRWNWVSGRAVYTNAGKDAEHIEPLGVSLKAGHTMAVYWMPGETAYTVEVYRQTELCA
jgi:hypothetical protein